MVSQRAPARAEREQPYRRHAITLCARVGLCAALLAPFTRLPHASAQPNEPARAATRDAALARSLFADGVAASERAAGDVAEDLLRRAYTLRATPGMAYNLAAALGHTGKLMQAPELCQHVAHDPSPALRS